MQDEQEKESEQRNDFQRGLLSVLFGMACLIVSIGVWIELAQLGEFSKPELQVAVWDKWGASSQHALWSGQWWGLITSVFPHVDLLQLVFSLSWIWIVIRRAEVLLGSLRWLGLFFLGAVITSAVDLGLSSDVGVGPDGVVFTYIGFIRAKAAHDQSYALILGRYGFAIALGWLVVCEALSIFEIWDVSLAAPLSGLVLGAALGLWKSRYALVVSWIPIIALSVLAFQSLVFCLWSADWHAFRASQALAVEDARAVQVHAEAALVLDPSHAYAFVLLGNSHMLKGDFQRAGQLADQAIELEPHYAPAHELRGDASMELQLWRRAERSYSKAIRLDGANAGILIERCELRRWRKKLSEALNDCNKGIELDPTSYGYSIRALVHRDANNLQTSVADFMRSLELEETAWTLTERAAVYKQLGDFAQAQADLSRAIELSPTYTVARGKRGEVFFFMNRYEEALTDLNAYIDAEPTESWSYLTRAKVRAAQGDRIGCESDVAEAVLRDKSTAAQAPDCGGDAPTQDETPASSSDDGDDGR